MWKYTHTDELYHYGILGMKWGVRRTKAYKQAKADYKKAKKDRFNAGLKRIGNTITNDSLFKISEYDTKSGAKVIKSQKTRNTAYANKVAAKAKLKSMTNDRTNKLGYNKAEFKTYVKGLKRSGVPNSRNDRSTQGMGTTMYNKIKSEKGKQYADAVLKKTSHKKVNAVVAGAVVSVGLAFAKLYIDTQDR